MNRHDRTLRDGHGPRWRRRAEARPDDILDAAMTCFLKDGYSGATMERIARGAGISKGAVYLYFESKEAMLTALIRRSVRVLAEAAAARLAAGPADDPVATLRETARLFSAPLADPKLFAAPRIVLAEAGRFPQLAEIYRREVIDIAMPAFARVIEQGQRSGVFRGVDVYVAVRSLIGGMLLEALWRGLFARGRDAAPEPADFIDAHLDIVLNGLCAPSSQGHSGKETA